MYADSDICPVDLQKAKVWKSKITRKNDVVYNKGKVEKLPVGIASLENNYCIKQLITSGASLKSTVLDNTKLFYFSFAEMFLSQERKHIKEFGINNRSWGFQVSATHPGHNALKLTWSSEKNSILSKDLHYALLRMQNSHYTRSQQIWIRLYQFGPFVSQFTDGVYLCITEFDCNVFAAFVCILVFCIILFRCKKSRNKKHQD